MGPVRGAPVLSMGHCASSTWDTKMGPAFHERVLEMTHAHK